MTHQSPPAWLQDILLKLLSARDRESIAGDLLEEYREARLPQTGSLRANCWYLRQIISFASIRVSGGKSMKQAAMAMCLFTAAAGIWLGIMENILKHDGYQQRSLVAACIALQGAATLVFLLLHGRSLYRIVVFVGAVSVMMLGVSAVYRIMQAQHFEGFVLLIGSALTLQGALTLITLLRPASSAKSA